VPKKGGARGNSKQEAPLINLSVLMRQKEREKRARKRAGEREGCSNVAWGEFNRGRPGSVGGKKGKGV